MVGNGGIVDNTTQPENAVGSELMDPKPQPETVNATVPTSGKPARKPNTVRRVRTNKPTAYDAAGAFKHAFPTVVTIPAWVVPMADAFRTIHANVKPENRKSYDAVLTVASRVITRPDDGTHAFTFGGVSDIAKTQNAIYVGLAVAGIPRAEISDAYGAALWTAVIGPAGPKTHRCEYRDHVEYFDSTLSRLCADDHNLTPGIPRSSVVTFVSAWRKPAKS